MAQRRRYTKAQKATAVIAAEMSSVAAAAEQTGIPRTTLIHWLDDPEMVALRQKTREEMAEGWNVLVHLAQERIKQLLPTMEARDVITLAGVGTDKGQLLSGQATARTETLTLSETLDDHEKDALADAIDDWLKERQP